MRQEALKVGSIDVLIIEVIESHNVRCSGHELSMQYARTGMIHTLSKRVENPVQRVVVQSRTIATIHRVENGLWLWGNISSSQRDSLIERIVRHHFPYKFK
jgi:hypothetical protein